MNTTSKNEVMVELYPGYGDGFGIVRLAENGQPDINPARRVTHWTSEDGTKIKMDAATSAILSRASVTLIDSGVRVDTGAIKRVIGPIECPEAIRVRATRYTKNWSDAGFISKATDDQLFSAMTRETEREVRAAMSALRASTN